MGGNTCCCWLRCRGARWKRRRQEAPAASAPPTAPAPAAETAPTNAPAPPLAVPEPLWRILIVEDDTKTAEVIQTALQLEGSGDWETTIARSGEEALQLLEAQPVDLILLDVRLPGISGAEVYRRLRAAPATQRLPILFLSGSTSFDLYVEGIQEGILLRKPFNIPELVAMVRANLPTAASAGQETPDQPDATA